MSDLILHHYPMSPFSEKVRAMLGYTDQSWQSVITREMPPRPLLATLAGGYRKIPVAQIGADVFCDSRTITSEIAAATSKPELALENGSDAVKAFVRKVDLEIFFACIMSGASKKLNRKVQSSMSWLDIGRFMWDRINMGLKSSVRIARGREATAMVNGHLASLESMLQQDFLFGSSPNIADFSAYHSLWFIRELGEKRSWIARFPNVDAWMNRMQAFGEGRRSEISPEQALAIARQAQPRPIADAHRDHARIGTSVKIAPDDYGQVTTQGILVGSTPEQWILARDEPAVGTLHLHFPKQGFALS